MSGIKKTLCFTYWTDPLCIWAYVAQAKLDTLLAESRVSLKVCHRVVPVFNSIPYRFTSGSWAQGGPAGRAQKTREVAARFDAHDVSGEVWVRDAPATSWAPAMAIKAAFSCERAGVVNGGSAELYQWRLRQSFFVENRNIARRRVQMEVAEACGFPTRELEIRLEDGRALAELLDDTRDKDAIGVRGSPTYVFDGAREMLYGNVPLSLIQATVELLASGGDVPGRSVC